MATTCSPMAHPQLTPHHTPSTVRMQPPQPTCSSRSPYNHQMQPTYNLKPPHTTQSHPIVHMQLKVSKWPLNAAHIQLKATPQSACSSRSPNGHQMQPTYSLKPLHSSHATQSPNSHQIHIQLKAIPRLTHVVTTFYSFGFFFLILI